MPLQHNHNLWLVHSDLTQLIQSDYIILPGDTVHSLLLLPTEGRAHGQKLLTGGHAQAANECGRVLQVCNLLVHDRVVEDYERPTYVQ